MAIDCSLAELVSLCRDPGNTAAAVVKMVESKHNAANTTKLVADLGFPAKVQAALDELANKGYLTKSKGVYTSTPATVEAAANDAVASKTTVRDLP